MCLNKAIVLKCIFEITLVMARDWISETMSGLTC
jgi:hypothetical protein